MPVFIRRKMLEHGLDTMVSMAVVSPSLKNIDLLGYMVERFTDLGVEGLGEYEAVYEKMKNIYHANHPNDKPKCDA